MTTTELRTMVGQIRMQRWQNTITVEDAKAQLENIEWTNVTDNTGLSVDCLQSMVNETIVSLNEGKL